MHFLTAGKISAHQHLGSESGKKNKQSADQRNFGPAGHRPFGFPFRRLPAGGIGTLDSIHIRRQDRRRRTLRRDNRSVFLRTPAPGRSFRTAEFHLQLFVYLPECIFDRTGIINHNGGKIRLLIG